MFVRLDVYYTPFSFVGSLRTPSITEIKYSNNIHHNISWHLIPYSKSNNVSSFPLAMFPTLWHL